MPALNETSLNIPDSVGLLHMARFTGQKLPERVAGVDTVRTLCRKLSRHHPVFLLGAGEGIAEKAAKELIKMNMQLQVVGTHSGSPRDEDAEEIINKIKEAKPHLLLVAFVLGWSGLSPSSPIPSGLLRWPVRCGPLLWLFENRHLILTLVEGNAASAVSLGLRTAHSSGLAVKVVEWPKGGQ